jgi:hypothetical protein
MIAPILEDRRACCISEVATAETEENPYFFGWAALNAHSLKDYSIETTSCFESRRVLRKG